MSAPHHRIKPGRLESSQGPEKHTKSFTSFHTCARRRRAVHERVRSVSFLVCADVPSGDHQWRQPARLEPAHLVPRAPPRPSACFGSPAPGTPPGTTSQTSKKEIFNGILNMTKARYWNACSHANKTYLCMPVVTCLMINLRLFKIHKPFLQIRHAIASSQHVTLHGSSTFEERSVRPPSLVTLRELSCMYAT